MFLKSPGNLNQNLTGKTANKPLSVKAIRREASSWNVLSPPKCNWFYLELNQFSMFIKDQLVLISLSNSVLRSFAEQEPEQSQGKQNF